MSKILTDVEMLTIIGRAVIGKEIDDRDQYIQFLEGLGTLITDYFGGETGTTDYAEGEYFTAFKLNEEVPPDGGVYKRYDEDVIWNNGEEFEERREHKREEQVKAYELKKDKGR